MKHTDKWNKQAPHEITGDGSHKIEAYKLSCTSQDHERRNFPGFQTCVPGEDLMNTISCEGTTETRGGKDMNHAFGKETYNLSRRYK